MESTVSMIVVPTAMLTNPNAGWSDTDLVEACRRGDAEAWSALLDKYKRLIYAIPFRYGATAADADDIFQAVCLELYEELPRLRRTEGLRSWLSTVTSRESLRWKQRTKRRGEEDLENAAEPVAETASLPELEVLERGQIVHNAIAAIPERCQRMVRMLFFEDPPRPYEAVAAELGLAIGSIGFIRGRCLNKLQKALEEAGF